MGVGEGLTGSMCLSQERGGVQGPAEKHLGTGGGKVQSQSGGKTDKDRKGKGGAGLPTQGESKANSTWSTPPRTPSDWDETGNLSRSGICSQDRAGDLRAAFGARAPPFLLAGYREVSNWKEEEKGQGRQTWRLYHQIQTTSNSVPPPS